MIWILIDMELNNLINNIIKEILVCWKNSENKVSACAKLCLELQMELAESQGSDVLNAFRDHILEGLHEKINPIFVERFYPKKMSRDEFLAFRQRQKNLPI